MIFSQNLIKLIRLNLSALHLLGPYPYKIDKDTCKLDFDKTNGLKKETLLIYLLLFISLIAIVQLSSLRDTFPAGIIYEGILYATLPLAMAVMVWAYFQKHSGVVELFNLLVTFERRFNHGRMPLLNVPNRDYIIAIKTFQFLGVGCNPIICTAHFIRYFFQKCLPYAPEFELLQQCNQNKNSSFYLEGHIATAYWLIICMIYYWSFLKVGLGFFFCTGQLYFVEGFCIRFYLKNMLKTSKRSSSSWYTFSNIRLYKQLQILVIYYSFAYYYIIVSIHCDIFTAVLLAITALGIVIGWFAIVTSWNAITYVQVAVLACCAFQAFFGLLICFGNFGGIYVDSLKFLVSLRSPVSGLLNKASQTYNLRCQRRRVRALQALKIKLGAVNFVDRFMPVKFLDFCFSLLVNMLLLKQ